MIDSLPNRCVIAGELLELETMRYTPAGVPRVALKIRHASSQQEAGGTRQLQCDIPAVALGEAAVQASQFSLGQVVKATGFLAQRSLKSTQLVLHIDNIILN